MITAATCSTSLAATHKPAFRCTPNRPSILSRQPLGFSKLQPSLLLSPATTDSVDTTPVLESNNNNNNNKDPATVEKVSTLLQLIQDTDSGDDIAPETRQAADAIVTELAQAGQGTRPLENDLVYGNYNVAYVSKGSSQYGAPAGGRFRTGLGKLLFSTRRLCQSVIRPDVVVNKVEFALLGFIPGAVGLRGNLITIPEKEGGVDLKDTVKVFFEPPVLSLPGFHITIGPPSSVVLKTTYLDERIRLGLGSRGSLFVFTRGGESDKAGMEKVGLEKTSPLGVVAVSLVLTAMILGGGWALFQQSTPVVGKAAALWSMLIGTALSGIFYRGGLFNDSIERPEVKAPSSPPAAAA